MAENRSEGAWGADCKGTQGAFWGDGGLVVTHVYMCQNALNHIT